MAEFVGWVIGTKDRPPVINSRKQRELDAILTSPKALQYFRSTRDPDSAVLYTEFNVTEVADMLRGAAYGIERCLPKLNDVREEDSVTAAFKELDNAFRKARLNMGGPAKE